MKPVKRGFKVWVRADSHNGYVFEFQCYTGKKGDTTEVGLGGSHSAHSGSGGEVITYIWTVFYSSVSLYQSY